MSVIFNETLFGPLRNGQLAIVYDDVETKVGNFVGIAEMVTPEAVNFITKVGKGLIYVCITEEKANQLNLPLMVRADSCKPLTVSVDYIGTTTGISAFERADTIKAFTDADTKPDDFRRPGHVFPLLSKDKGLLQRVGIAEAATDLARMVSAAPIAYTGEILNNTGEIATKEEIIQIAEAYGLHILYMSEIMEFKKSETLGSFNGLVIQGREVGKQIGFPTAHLLIDLKDPLGLGVYGVTIRCNQVTYYGVMNVGYRPTFNQDKTEIHYEVHLLESNHKVIYGKALKVDVNFFVREEISFQTVDQLIHQIGMDTEYVKTRFGLLTSRSEIR
jgi:3,4-dihydroxy-2-butanone 4-phosphate synthase